MKAQKVSFFKQKKDFFRFLGICLFILCYSLLIEFQNYKQLTNFDTAIVKATILKQYIKKKNGKIYQVLKLKSNKGFVFFTSAKKTLPNIIDKEVTLEIYTTRINFLNYLKYFYAHSHIIDISQTKTLKGRLNLAIDNAHHDKNIASIYKALYTATPLTKELQTTFSALGVSHLLAISGFHLGVLSAFLLFLLKYPYQFFQDRYFPYRNQKRDIFMIIFLILFSYLLFLDLPPSLLRAFFMFFIGFILYDRGIKIVSMQTLYITIMLLLSFIPRLFFTLGFWLSVSGVFYIFLYLIHFKNQNKIWQFISIPIWVYFMMLPLSLSIFHNFSIYHPLSIVWSMLFALFYPLSIILHLVGLGDLLDFLLTDFLLLKYRLILVSLNSNFIYIYILLSFLAVFKKRFIWLLIFFNIFLFLFIYSTVDYPSNSGL